MEYRRFAPRRFAPRRFSPWASSSSPPPSWRYTWLRGAARGRGELRSNFTPFISDRSPSPHLSGTKKAGLLEYAFVPPGVSAT